jgi:alpha-galactosidase/6-phospho-beta-glucosidase family protein
MFPFNSAPMATFLKATVPSGSLAGLIRRHTEGTVVVNCDMIAGEQGISSWRCCNSAAHVASTAV